MAFSVFLDPGESFSRSRVFLFLSFLVLILEMEMIKKGSSFPILLFLMQVELLLLLFFFQFPLMIDKLAIENQQKIGVVRTKNRKVMVIRSNEAPISFLLFFFFFSF